MPLSLCIPQERASLPSSNKVLQEPRKAGTCPGLRASRRQGWNLAPLGSCLMSVSSAFGACRSSYLSFLPVHSVWSPWAGSGSGPVRWGSWQGRLLGQVRRAKLGLGVQGSSPWGHRYSHLHHSGTCNSHHTLTWWLCQAANTAIPYRCHGPPPQTSPGCLALSPSPLEAWRGSWGLCTMGSAFCALHNVPRVPSGAVCRAKAGMHSLAPAPKKHVLTLWWNRASVL